MSFLKEKADFIRKDVVDVCVANGAGHIAPSLSCVDILVALYYDLMDYRKDEPLWDERDRFILSKGHGCYSLYAILTDIGMIDRADWEKFYKGGFLKGCVGRDIAHGLEAGTGALGHGLPMAVGMAFAAKLQDKNWRVYCVVGDGEMQEGSNWEALQFAVKHGLNNLTMIVDHNRLQAMDFLEEVLTVEGRVDDLQRKLEAFGVEVKTCGGHDIESICTTINKWKKEETGSAFPQALMANTVKGYGVEAMENVPKFHFRLPTEEELKRGKRYE